MNKFRTDRHNNPTAFTTDLAKQAGLVKGVDYEDGDAFPNNPKMKTARILGDCFAVTIRLIDAVGFYTAKGNLRWLHTACDKKEWEGFSTERKIEVIKKMYKREGGSGVLLKELQSNIL